jgi:CheY-like chemotaxis protein
MALEDASYNVVEASNGDEALQAIPEHRPDVVLLDITMPEKDGWETLGELKADARLRGIPVVMVSWRGEPDAQLRGIAAGAQAYVPKPSDTRTLIRIVEAAMGKQQPR